ncbi:MAG: membrane dipeptidase [Gemmatimonadaceae bacterium]
MPSTRRSFLTQALQAVVATPFLQQLPWPGAHAIRATRAATPFPFVDGLTFMGPPEELAASGLSAFLLDVSAPEPIKTSDGSIRYFRSYAACMKSLTDMRRQLGAGGFGGAFQATKGHEIGDAYRTGRTAVFFQFQGCEPIGAELDRVQEFYDLGLRVLQITHHNNNAWGGGAIEPTWSGLTTVGFAGVERMNALGIIPDLSHVADPTARDVLRTSTRPVIVSHGAARALVNNARCTPDDIIRGVANSGGAMGIFMMSFWLTNDAVPTVDAYVRQIRHVVKVGGIDAVGIANDYPVGGEANARSVGNDNAKAVATYLEWWDDVARQGVLGFDRRPTHVVIPELNNPRRAFTIAEALDRAGFRTGEVEKIMGGNWTRVLTESLGS